MGQRLCGCLVRTCCPSAAAGAAPRSSLVKPALQKKDDDAAAAEPLNQQHLQLAQLAQREPHRAPEDCKGGGRDDAQPLVVEDESWKKWSSYNLIHNQSALQKQQSAYVPPPFVSPGGQQQQQQQQHQPAVPAEVIWQQQQHVAPAEAVWDL